MIVTLDTILRWHRQLIASEWRQARGRPATRSIRAATMLHMQVAWSPWMTRKAPIWFQWLLP